MEFREFGRTGLSVSAISFGAGHIGSPEMDEQHVARLLNEALDSGINLVDTARSYGESEHRIGRHLSHRRHEFILSTKVGYNFGEKPDWSYESTLGTIDEALVRLRTDYLDVVHLHSCDKWFLERGDSVLALEKAKEQGKIRVIAYSGENEALDFAISSNRFDSIQCSVNIFDQQCIDGHLHSALQKGMGIIAKRPLGNAVWRYSHRPDGHGHAAYWDRMQQLDFKDRGLELYNLALRFTAFSYGVHTLIAGTASMEHLRKNITALENGPLPADLYAGIREEFKTKGPSWTGLI